MNAFPRAQGALSHESYLTLLLLALIGQVGGELRISAPAFDNLDSGGKLLVDWDTAAQQLVLRAGSPSLVIAEARGSGWTKPTTLSPQSPAQPDPSKHRVMTEDQIIDALERRMQSQRMREWREQGTAAVSSMPPPDESK
jgi:hypothetical protein